MTEKLFKSNRKLNEKPARNQREMSAKLARKIDRNIVF
jgi:hypothetical protein